MPAFQKPADQTAQRLLSFGVPQDIIDSANGDAAILQKMEQMVKQKSVPKKAFQKTAEDTPVPVSNLTMQPDNDIEASLKSMPGLPDFVQESVRKRPEIMPAVKQKYLQDINSGAIKIPEDSYLEDSKAIKSQGLDQPAMMKQADEDFSYGEFVAKKFAQGASFDIYDPEITAPSTAGKVVGVLSNLAGGAVTTSAVVWSLGSLGVFGGMFGTAATTAQKAKQAKQAFRIAKLASKADDVEIAAEAASKLPALKKSLRMAQGAKSVAAVKKAAVEGAVIGAGVGQVKSVVRGYGFEDAMTQVLSDSIDFTAMGVAGAKTFETLANFVTRHTRFKGEKAVKEFLSTEANQSMLKQASKFSLEDVIAAKEADPVGWDKMMAGTDLPTQGQLKQIDRTVMAIQKIKETKPFLSPSELLANPDVLNAITQTDRANVARQLFTDASSPYNFLYKTNTDLQKQVNRGHFGEAFDMLRVELGKLTAGSKEFSEFAAMPFLNDAESLAMAKASAITSRTSLMKKGVDVKNVHNILVQYEMNPTPDLEFQAQKALRKKAFQRFKSNDFKLSPTEVDDLVNNTIQKNLDILKDGKIRLEDIGILQDQDAMIKAMTTHNYQLGKKLFDSFESIATVDQNMGRFPPELKAIKDPLLKQRAYQQELGQYYRSLSDQKKALKVATEEGLQTPLGLKEMQDRIGQTFAKINTKIREIKTIELQLKGSKPEDIEAAKKLVNDAWAPTRSQFAGVSAQKVDLTSGEFDMDRIAGKNQPPSMGKLLQTHLPYENPVYLKQGSEVADYLHSLLVTNQDMKPFAKISLLNVKRQLSSEFGINNPISQMTVDALEQRNRAILVEQNNIMKRVNALKIKKGSEDANIVEKMIEGKILPTDDFFTSLPIERQNKLLKGKDELSALYKQMLTDVNVAQKENGLPLIPELPNYVHRFRQMDEDLPGMFKKFLEGSSEDVSPANEWKFRNTIDPKNIPMPASKHRTGVLDSPGDAIAGIEKYTKSALERKYLTDLLLQVDRAKWMAPDNLREFFQTFKDQYLLRVPEDRNQLHGVVKKGLDVARHRSANSMLLGKVSTLLRQGLSAVGGAGLSPKNALRSIVTIGTKESNELAALSTNLASRSLAMEGIGEKVASKGSAEGFKKVFNGIANKTIKPGYEASKAFMEQALKLADYEAAKHTFLTGYHTARDNGLAKDAAVRFGDFWAESIQGGMTKLGQPEFYQSTLGRALGQFQSFTINFFAAISHDLPRYADSDGAAKATTLMLRTYAGMAITNEVLNSNGLPGAFDLTSFIPFASTARFGFPGAVGATFDVAQYGLAKASGDEFTAAKKENELKTAAVAIGAGFAGAGQLYTSYSGATSEGFDDASLAEKAKFIAFGKGSAFIKEKYERDVEEEENKPFRQKIKRFVRKNF